jgi:hypothetical protein
MAALELQRLCRAQPQQRLVQQFGRLLARWRALLAEQPVGEGLQFGAGRG